MQIRVLFSYKLSGVMATDENVVIGYRVGKEITADSRCSLDPNLRAAEVGFKLATLERDIFGQQTRQIAAEFNKCIIACRQVAMNSYAYT